jgi:hypothetical protein
MTNTDARLWHPSLRINRVLRVMLHTRWNAEAWLVVRVQFRRALALRSEIRRAGRFNYARDRALLVRRCAGARPRVRLDSPLAILHIEVPMRLIGPRSRSGLHVAPRLARARAIGTTPAPFEEVSR